MRTENSFFLFKNFIISNFVYIYVYIFMHVAENFHSINRKCIAPAINLFLMAMSSIN
jgi:hypothetical protein